MGCGSLNDARDQQMKKGSCPVPGSSLQAVVRRDTHHNKKNSGILDVMRILDPFIARSIGYETVVAILCNCFRINVFPQERSSV